MVCENPLEPFLANFFPWGFSGAKGGSKTTKLIFA